MSLTKENITRHLQVRTKAMIPNIVVLPSVTSTNDVLYEKIKNHPTQHCAVFAETQTQGRGQFGRHWVSPPHCNLYFSLSWHFQKTQQALMGLSMIVGDTVLCALKTSGITESIYLKHPNDFMHEQKKFGGILIDTIPVSANACTAIIGIGINVNANKNDLSSVDQPWTALSLLMHQEYDRAVVAATLLDALASMDY